MDRLLRSGYRRLVRPLLFGLGDGDPETAHESSLRMLAGLTRTATGRRMLGLLHRSGDSVAVGPLQLSNRVGLAAGLDKRGEAIRGWSSFGFGHVELGTVTPQPQPGNERPRIFRLPASGALINRMGFPSDGVEALVRQLQGARIERGNDAVGAAVGVSLGKNKDTPLERAAEDYLASFAAVAAYADYIAVNVSSPNTPGLRDLQDGPALTALLGALTAAARSGSGPAVPIFVKIAPDLSWSALDQALVSCADAGVDGLIAGNTTLSRDAIAAGDAVTAEQTGGLSGHPLARRARQVVQHLTDVSDWPVIGVGGIMTPTDAQAMFDAGARAVQLYTGWIYSGPALVNGIHRLRPSPPGTQAD